MYQKMILKWSYFNWNTIWSSEVLQTETTPSKPSGMCMYHQVEHRKTLNFEHTEYICISCNPHRKQQLFLCIALTDWRLTL